jgi:hypothetical protein
MSTDEGRYAFRCLLPDNRLLTRLDDTRVVAAVQHAADADADADADDDDDAPSPGSYHDALSRDHGFIYVSRLHFMHEADLRNYMLWGLDKDAGLDDSRDLGIDHLLNTGQV